MTLLLALCCLVSGHVASSSGVAITNARISLIGPSRKTVISNAQGTFSAQVRPGTYDVHADEQGFAGVDVAAVSVDKDTRIDIVLEPLDTAKLRVIGSVTVNGRLARISGAIPSLVVTRADMERTGDDRIVQGLLALPSLDVQYPHNAGPDGLATVSLRGPDPSETMITLDGQLLNDANTGDVDVSQLPVAAFSSINVTEGLGPQDLEGSSTIGGAVNLISLTPTLAPHSAVSLSAGSFGQSEVWWNATGAQKKLGYALALDDQQEGGYVNETDDVCSFDTPPACAPEHLGSAVSQRSALANLRYSFSERADVGFRVFTLGDTRDESAAISGYMNPNPPSYDPNQTGTLYGPGLQTFQQSIRAYDLRERLPLGAGELVADASVSDDNVGVNGAGIGNPLYDLSHDDRRTNASLEWDRSLDRFTYAFGGYVQRETFDAPGTVASLGQHIASYFARMQWEPLHKVRLGAGAYLSNYSTFGSNLDGRFDAIYDTDPRTTLRFSAGTGFRAPLLIERYVFPDSQLPPPDVNCVISGQGNPDEKPEHATEYELGASHEFGTEATLDASVYRTNLRDPIENYYPGNSCGTPRGYAYSYPVNIGNAVYEGAEVRYVQHITTAHMYLTAMYGLNVAYPEHMPLTVSNPTSGAFIVNGEQFADIPQQQATLEADWADNGWHAGLAADYRGANNPLDQPPVVFVNGAAGRAIGKDLDLAIAATNLFNTAAQKFQVFNGGIPYYGVVADTGALGNLPTNLLTTQPFGLRVILTFRQ
jgi:outer membrane receptor protein involved in Fe transport